MYVRYGNEEVIIERFGFHLLVLSPQVGSFAVNNNKSNISTVREGLAATRDNKLASSFMFSNIQPIPKATN
jgi:hypothetical protein